MFSLAAICSTRLDLSAREVTHSLIGMYLGYQPLACSTSRLMLLKSVFPLLDKAPRFILQSGAHHAACQSVDLGVLLGVSRQGLGGVIGHCAS